LEASERRTPRRTKSHPASAHEVTRRAGCRPPSLNVFLLKRERRVENAPAGWLPLHVVAKDAAVCRSLAFFTGDSFPHLPGGQWAVRRRSASANVQATCTGGSCHSSLVDQHGCTHSAIGRMCLWRERDI
jgi:hypothetical protein